MKTSRIFLPSLAAALSLLLLPRVQGEPGAPAEFIPFTLSFPAFGGQGGAPSEITVEASGAFSLAGKMLGTIRPDGAILNPDGVELARLTPDGILELKGSPEGGGMIRDNGDLGIGAMTGTWNKGEFTVHTPAFEQAQVVATVDPDKPEVRRWASCLCVLMLLVERVEASPEPREGGQADPGPPAPVEESKPKGATDAESKSNERSE